MDNSTWKPNSEFATRIVGAGAYVPDHVVTAAAISHAIPGWPAEKIVEKTGIVERRYLWPLDVERGRAVPPSQPGDGKAATAADMGESALRDALQMADVRADEVDVLVVVTCTPDQPHFSHDAMAIQRRVGVRKDAHCFVVDSGCGGSLYVLDMLVRMLSSGGARTAAVVGTNLTSPLLNREVYSQRGLVADDGSAISPYLSTYVFGDGAGAIVARRDRGSALGIQGSLAGNDSQELVRCPGGGSVSPPYGERYRPLDHAFIVDGRLVASTYFDTMRRCIKTVADHAKCPLRDVERFYLHQPNVRVLGALAERLELRPEQVASNVARIGNTSSAGMFMLLAEDLQSGRVALGSGAPVLFAAIGAGVHYAAQLALL